MNRLFLILLLALATPAALAQATRPVSSAPPSLSDKGAAERAIAGVVFVVRLARHAEAALQTAGTLRKRPAYDGVPIDLVVCGGGSSRLLASDPGAGTLTAEAERLGVRLLACGMSLGELGIDPEALAPGIAVVPNGLLHAVDRQAEGFLSVEL